MDRIKIRNSHHIFLDQQTLGQKASDRIASLVGSWRFIIGQTFLIGLWVVVNSIAWMQHWDPYPFILMNLMLSMQAALTAPIIMMSQNRQAEKDRIDSHNDYEINLKAEAELQSIIKTLAENQENIQKLIGLVEHLQPHDKQNDQE